MADTGDSEFCLWNGKIIQHYPLSNKDWIDINTWQFKQD